MDVMDAIRMRRSVRKYSSKPIPEETMERLREALRLAPSACNYQPWTFVVVMGADIKRKLADASRNQLFMADAPVIVVGVGFPDNAYRNMGGHGNSAEIDVTIALDHLTLVAAAEGIGTCWIGAFNEEKVKALLGVPDHARVVAMMPLGYPADPAMLHPLKEDGRKPEREVFAQERFA